MKKNYTEYEINIKYKKEKFGNITIVLQERKQKIHSEKNT